VHTGFLHIGFGSVDEGDNHEKKSVAMAQRVVDALSSVGFEPEWGGTLEERILVKGLVWEEPVSEGRGIPPALAPPTSYTLAHGPKVRTQSN